MSENEGQLHQAQLANLAAMARSIFHQVGATEVADPQLTTLGNFNGTDGDGPAGSLLADANGDLFGTTTGGGEHNAGTVFEIAKTATGYASTPTTLVSFHFGVPNDPIGSFPYRSGVIADADGNLFGTTENGGVNDAGTVFEIAKTATGYASTPTTLVSFNRTDGTGPLAGVIADAHGNLFGTTVAGGEHNAGTVFEIAKTATGYASTPTTLVSFNITNGSGPFGSLIADAHGDLFGTTTGGGANNDGTVFEIAKTAHGYSTTPTTLVSFNGTNGALPFGSLITDAHGDLFGTTAEGGEHEAGSVFEIAKTAHGYSSTPTTLVSFDGTNGAGPWGSLIADAHGDLFGTTIGGGANDDGTVFEIAKTAHGYSSTPTTLVSFDGTNGAGPFDSLIADAKGNLFGTVLRGGANNDGFVFEITGSGFSTHTPPTTIIRGNSDNISVFADNTSRYTIIVGNGSNDFVSAEFSSHDKITLGNGADDTVQAFTSSDDKISLGNGRPQSLASLRTRTASLSQAN
jgi:uncharacterized repeat protein (TIGR03803 family)